jgi:hypothetical protein
VRTGIATAAFAVITNLSLGGNRFVVPPAQRRVQALVHFHELKSKRESADHSGATECDLSL